MGKGSTALAIAGLTAVLGLSAHAPASAADPAPYAGQEQRSITALSPEDVAALLDGQGWGFAKPAELNGLPGPRHVLDLADELALDAGQRAQIEAIFRRMQASARALGADYVAAEAELDTLFESGGATAETVRAAVGRAAAVEADLRAVHLTAHLETAPLLTRHQRMIYAQERGYGAGQSHGSGHGH